MVAVDCGGWSNSYAYQLGCRGSAKLDGEQRKPGEEHQTGVGLCGEDNSAAN